MTFQAEISLDSSIFLKGHFSRKHEVYEPRNKFFVDENLDIRLTCPNVVFGFCILSTSSQNDSEISYTIKEIE
jgi:hypothetical protein